jgi:hypothetical protein
MPDLQIPQRQTYPAIRGLVRDEQGLLPLATADDIFLLLEGPGGTPLISLPVNALSPTETFFVDGVSFQANWEAPLVGATTAVATARLYKAKLKIIWQAVPLLQQYAPQVDFIDIEIVTNVAESP